MINQNVPQVALGLTRTAILGRRFPGWVVVSSKTTRLVEGLALRRRIEANPVIFTVVPRADGTYDVEASDGGTPSFLISFWTEGEAEAWITKLKGVAN